MATQPGQGQMSPDSDPLKRKVENVTKIFKYTLHHEDQRSRGSWKIIIIIFICSDKNT